VNAAKAKLAQAQATLERLETGARPEELAQAKAAANPLTDKRLAAEIERLEQDTRLKRLKVLAQTGQLVKRDDVVRETAALVTRIKERLLALPDEFETRFPAEVREQCKADLMAFVVGVLLEMSAWRVADLTTNDHILRAADLVLREKDAELGVTPVGQDDDQE